MNNHNNTYNFLKALKHLEKKHNLKLVVALDGNQFDGLLLETKDEEYHYYVSINKFNKNDKDDYKQFKINYKLEFNILEDFLYEEECKRLEQEQKEHVAKVEQQCAVYAPPTDNLIQEHIDHCNELNEDYLKFKSLIDGVEHNPNALMLESLAKHNAAQAVKEELTLEEIQCNIDENNYHIQSQLERIEEYKKQILGKTLISHELPKINHSLIW